MTMKCRCGQWTWEPAKITGLQMERGYWFKQGKQITKKDPPFICDTCGCKLGSGTMVVPPNKGDRLY